MTDDPRGAGLKTQSKEKSVPSCNQPDCRTVDSPAGNIEKSNKTAVINSPPWADGSAAANIGQVGKGTTNPPQSKESGLRTMDQGFTPGSGVPPSRLGD